MSPAFAINDLDVLCRIVEGAIMYLGGRLTTCLWYGYPRSYRLSQSRRSLSVYSGRNLKP